MVVGCSVGRLTLLLTNLFEKVVGIDTTTRFFLAATHLQQKKYYTVQTEPPRTICLNETECPNYSKALFVQQKPNNIDDKKFNSFDAIVVDGFSIVESVLPSALEQIHRYSKKGGVLFLSLKEESLKAD